MGYIFAYAVARWRGQKLVLWLALLVGMLPDFDIYFAGLGLVHHTYTHSLLLLLPLAAFVVWRRRDSLPYVVGALQHVVVGDFLVNSFPVLLPLASLTVGLGLGMPSAADSVIEFGSLALMALIMWRSGDLGRLLDGSRENLLIAIPLFSISSLTWVAAGQPELGALVSFGFSRLALEAISVGQIALAALMALSMLKSMAPYIRGTPRTDESTTPEELRG
jgi:hypothetical protein